LNAKVFFPIHWGKFDLSVHQWKEPVERAGKAAKEKGVSMATPVVGEVFRVGDYPSDEWWTIVKP